jgi:hypothetical protein
MLGGLLILESGRRYTRIRRAVRLLKNKEAQLGFEIGTIRQNQIEIVGAPGPT